MTSTIQSDKLLLKFLDKCSESSGTYVSHGRSSMGFQYSSTSDVFSYVTINDLQEQTTTPTTPTTTIFVKMVPIHKEKANDSIPLDEIESSSREEFLRECKFQDKIFKKSNHYFDSFTLPIYEVIIIDNTNIPILETIKKKTKTDNYEFIEIMLKKLQITDCKDNCFELGLIVMPFMKIKTLHNYLFDKITEEGSDSKSTSNFFLTKISRHYLSTKDRSTMGNNQYDRYDIIVPEKRDDTIFSIMIQLIYYMIQLFDMNRLHGDLHFNNVLIETKQSYPHYCYETKETSDSPCYKIYIIDFGRSEKHIEPKTIRGLLSKITFSSSLTSESSFRNALIEITKLMMKKEDQDDRYSWFINLIYNIPRSTRRTKQINEGNITELYRLITNYHRNMNEHYEKFFGKLIEEQKERIKEMRQKYSSKNLLVVKHGGDNSEIIKKMNIMIKNIRHGTKTYEKLATKVKTRKKRKRSRKNMNTRKNK